MPVEPYSSSDSGIILLPAPSHLASQLPARQTLVFAGFVLPYSGGTVPEFALAFYQLQHGILLQSGPAIYKPRRPTLQPFTA